ncbi:MAG: CotH kinase family protein [Gemmataceae bacterium]|nr:CotH kinase family protein [Gemmataceae bacterium]
MLCAILLLAAPKVVVNEILYHAPDDQDALQFIELHNAGDKDADLSGWKLARSVEHAFPAGTRLAAGGFLVLCKDAREFKRHYGSDAVEWKGSLGHDKGHVELLDAAGKRVDSVKYRSRGPWPLAADGYSSSLERICPDAPGDDPRNWAPSPLPERTPRAGGTPGKKNAAHSAVPLPRVSRVAFTPVVGEKDEIKVEADARSEKVELLWRACVPGREGEEKAVAVKAGAGGRFSLSLPAQKAGTLVRFRFRAIEGKAVRLHPHPEEVRPAFSVYVRGDEKPGKIPLGFIVNTVRAKEGRPKFFGAPPSPAPPPRGTSAYVHVDTAGKARLFDFIHVTPRNGGRKVRFHKDRPLDGMRTINLIHEHVDRFALSEHLSMRVHALAGNAAPRTGFVRTWIDGSPIGYQLLVEQPNKAYLKRHGLHANGNLYKANWTGWTITGRHEKKTNTRTGHDDLLKLVADLGKGKAEDKRKVIEKEIDARQVATHYAVRTILSDWDGFFNNYFLHRDTRPGGKWTLHPWDQDKTWGWHDGNGGATVWFDMPITYGMEGDRPPPLKPGEPNFGFGGPPWWRRGGDLSRPLLAHPEFRKRFLARTKELLETAYAEKAIEPLVKELASWLEDEVPIRARLVGEDPKAATARLKADLDALREHRKKRSEFLLAQDEIKKAGKPIVSP